jgi:hypothetical protein
MSSIRPLKQNLSESPLNITSFASVILLWAEPPRLESCSAIKKAFSMPLPEFPQVTDFARKTFPPPLFGPDKKCHPAHKLTMFFRRQP